MPRRSTRGPLDMDEEDKEGSTPATTAPQRQYKPPTPALQTALPPSPAAGPSSTMSPIASTLLSPIAANPSRTRTPSPSPGRLPLDLTPLLRPALYNPIPFTGIASPFLDSSSQPPDDATLPTLLSQHRFLHAAARAAQDLTSSSSSSSGGTAPKQQPQEILSLYQTRLSCLLLSSHPEIAAKESKPLSDMLARESGAYTRPEREIFLNQIPWSLRLLLLRLQTFSSSASGGDSRRAIMGLYALASECRSLGSKARRENDAEMVRVWKARLRDVGVRVAGELMALNEFETARRHLAILSEDDDDEDLDERERENMLVRETLLCLRIGDVAAARSRLSASTSTSESLQHSLLEALISLASSSYSTALSQLQTLHAANPDHDLITHNLAIAYLYTGDVTTASKTLDSMVDDKTVFPTLLFNLATVFELRTEKGRDRKLGLVDRVAGIKPGEVLASGGWERNVSEFKLA